MAGPPPERQSGHGERVLERPPSLVIPSFLVKPPFLVCPFWSNRPFWPNLPSGQTSFFWSNRPFWSNCPSWSNFPSAPTPSLVPALPAAAHTVRHSRHVRSASGGGTEASPSPGRGPAPGLRRRIRRQGWARAASGRGSARGGTQSAGASEACTTSSESVVRVGRPCRLLRAFI